MPPPQGSWNPIEGPGDFTTTKLVHSDTYAAINPATTANLSGAAVFVTGASKGFGRAIAVSYACAGASKIAIGARSDQSATEQEILEAAKEAGRPVPRVLALKLDVSQRASVEAAAAAIEKEFGALDVVVSNAGILKGAGPLAVADPEEWWETITTNLRGFQLVARSTIPLLQKGQLKTLIAVSSVGGQIVTPNVSGYQLSKAAICRLIEFIAMEYGNIEDGIIAFSVHPGNSMTEIVDLTGMDPRFGSIFTETTRLCGDSLVFLSKERRDWLNGRYVNVTWDLPELVAEPLREEIIKGDKLKSRLIV